MDTRSPKINGDETQRQEAITIPVTFATPPMDVMTVALTLPPLPSTHITNTSPSEQKDEDEVKDLSDTVADFEQTILAIDKFIKADEGKSDEVKDDMDDMVEADEVKDDEGESDKLVETHDDKRV